MGLAAPYNIFQPILSEDAIVSFRIAPAFIRLLTFKDYCDLNEIRTPKAKHYKAYMIELKQMSMPHEYKYEYQWFVNGKCVGQTSSPTYTIRGGEKKVICKVLKTHG